jgi:hypothetical protein
LVQVWNIGGVFITRKIFILHFLFRMAQAVVLQAEILAKDVSAIDALWVDTLKNQERFQFSYSTKLHELVEAIKRRQNFPTGEILSSAEPRMTAGTADCKYNKNFSQGLVTSIHHNLL